MRAAVATLAYGRSDDAASVAFVAGARALALSLRATSSQHTPPLAMVVLHPWAEPVHPDVRRQLSKAGWHTFVEAARHWHRPDGIAVSSARLRAAYAKLAIFELAYSRVIYMDADVLAVHHGAIDHLLECAGFCASLRHSELFNSGVMVVEPSLELARDMLAKIHDTYSYTGGDQGFLNSYFAHFASCPELASEGPCHRLPAAFNDDWPLVFARGRGPTHPYLIHFTLGATKAWTWQLAPFLPNSQWRQYTSPAMHAIIPFEAVPSVALTCSAAACLGHRRIRLAPVISFSFVVLAFAIAANFVPNAASAPIAWTRFVSSFAFQIAAPLYVYLRALGPIIQTRCLALTALLCLSLLIALIALPTCLLDDRSWTLQALLAIELPILYACLVMMATALKLISQLATPTPNKNLPFQHPACSRTTSELLHAT